MDRVQRKEGFKRFSKEALEGELKRFVSIITLLV